MKVNEIMLQDVESCDSNDNLKKAAEIMQKKICDFIPVVNDENIVIGIVTQENICKTIAAFEQTASAIKIDEIDYEKAVICLDDEKIEKVMKIMSKNLVKRLIITSQDGQPVGIISIELILSLSGKKKKLQKKAFSVLKSILKPQPIVLHQI